MQYGTTYSPLLAVVSANRNRPDQVVAHIDGQLCFFERGTPQPRAGETVEVMVTRPVYPKRDQGGIDRPDFGSISGLQIQVVDRTKHMLVAIDGFECSGSMCRTTAHGRETDGHRAMTSEEVYCPKRRDESHRAWLDRSRGGMWLTPGRSDIFVAENVNTRFDRREPTPRRPMNVWVERAVVEEKSGCGVRVAGLSRVEDLRVADLVRKPRPARIAA